MRHGVEEWIVVRKSRRIPGGYRVVKTHLTEEEARSLADWYKRPSQAMRMRELVEIRMEALAEMRAAEK